MPYFYSDPERESDLNALPDVEVFAQTTNECEKREHPFHLESEECLFRGPGYYYVFGARGCLWATDPVGPFGAEAGALAAAREDRLTHPPRTDLRGV